MKKIFLLSGVAFLTMSSARAMSWNMHDYMPYVGAEYAFSRAHNGGMARNIKNDYHTGKFDLGMQMFQNWSMEFSYQMSGELKSRSEDGGLHVKSSYEAYALDMYGKYPIMCSNFGALGTIGGAIYHAEFKGLPDKSFNRVGYRIGGGMQYDFNKNLAARIVGRYSYIGAERLNNFKEITVGMLYRF